MELGVRCRETEGKKRKIRTQFLVYLRNIEVVLSGCENAVELLQSTFEFLEKIEGLEFANFCSRFPYQAFWNYILSVQDPVIVDNGLALLGKVSEYSKFDPSFIALETFPFLASQLTKSRTTSRAVLRILCAIAENSVDGARFVYNTCLGVFLELPMSQELCSIMIPMFSVEQEPRPEVTSLILKCLETDSDLYYWECGLQAMSECFKNLRSSLTQESLGALQKTLEHNHKIWFSQIDEGFVRAYLQALVWFSPLPVEFGAMALEQAVAVMSGNGTPREKGRVVQKLADLVCANRDGWLELAVPWMGFVNEVFDEMPFGVKRAVVRALLSICNLNAACETSPRIAQMIFVILQENNDSVVLLHGLNALWQSNGGNADLRNVFLENFELLENLSDSERNEIATSASALCDTIA